VIVMSVVLSLIMLVVIAYYYARHRFRRFVRDVDRQQRERGQTPPGPGRGYPTTGTKGPDPQLPE
jgi:hypothetical protein